MILYTTGLSLSEILTTAFFAWVVVIMGLAGALTSTIYKWGYFVMGVVALFYIWCVSLPTTEIWFLIFPSRPFQVRPRFPQPTHNLQRRHRRPFRFRPRRMARYLHHHALPRRLGSFRGR